MSGTKDKLKELFGEFSSSDEEALRPAPAPDPLRRTAPRVGTSVQRFDATNRRKAIMPTTPPPPTPPGKRRLSASPPRPMARAIRSPPPTPTGKRRPSVSPPRPTAQVSRSPPPASTGAQRPSASPPGSTARTPRSPSTRPARTTKACSAMSTSGKEASASPRPPPPVKIQVAPGTTLYVPHYVVHRAKRFRAWTPEGEWVLQFDHHGRLRSSRLRPRSTTATVTKGGDVTMQ